jgi:hypothetical protein
MEQIWHSARVALVLGGAASMAAACASPPKMVDPCVEQAPVPGGAADLGLGVNFMPVSNGQPADVVLGTQTLHMFVVNVRVRDLDVSATRFGGVRAVALGQGGAVISMDYGCRSHSFMESSDGWLYADSAYFLPLNSDAVAQVDGTAVMLQVTVTDQMGQQATDTRTVMARVQR